MSSVLTTGNGWQRRRNNWKKTSSLMSPWNWIRPQNLENTRKKTDRVGPAGVHFVGEKEEVYLRRGRGRSAVPRKSRFQVLWESKHWGTCAELLEGSWGATHCARCKHGLNPDGQHWGHAGTRTWTSITSTPKHRAGFASGEVSQWTLVLPPLLPGPRAFALELDVFNSS